MKIKADFITNSSSTSFVAWGIEVDRYSDIQAKYGNKIFEIYCEYCKETGDDSPATMLEMFEENDTVEIFDIMSRRAGLESASPTDCDYILVGESPFDMKDDQTLSDFKKRVCEKFLKMGIEITPDELAQIEEGWYEG